MVVYRQYTPLNGSCQTNLMLIQRALHCVLPAVRIEGQLEINRVERLNIPNRKLRPSTKRPGGEVAPRVEWQVPRVWGSNVPLNTAPLTGRPYIWARPGAGGAGKCGKNNRPVAGCKTNNNTPRRRLEGLGQGADGVFGWKGVIWGLVVFPG